MMNVFRLCKRLENEDGASTVEFIILFPIFIATVFVTVEAGWLMTKKMMLMKYLVNIS